MNSQDKINGQSAACRSAARILYRILWSEDEQYAYENNRYASEESKKAFKHEIERIVVNLYNRESRLNNRLSELMVTNDQITALLDGEL